jgi:hypothetical protein
MKKPIRVRNFFPPKSFRGRKTGEIRSNRAKKVQSQGPGARLHSACVLRPVLRVQGEKQPAAEILAPDGAMRRLQERGLEATSYWADRVASPAPVGPGRARVRASAQQTPGEPTSKRGNLT